MERKVVIFRDALDDIERNPRDVTLFGEPNMIHTETMKYDLYYYLHEGVRHPKNLNTMYNPLPIFLWLGPDSEKRLMQRIKEYHDTYQNNLAGTCEKDIFCLYPVERTSSGLIVHPTFNHNSTDKDSFLAEVIKNPGWEDFPEELAQKIKQLEEELRVED